MTRGARAVVLAVAASAALGARPAAAYVRYKTDSGIGFFWPQDCVIVTVYPKDLLTMTADQVLHAVTAAGNAWSSAGDACTYMNIMVSSDPPPGAGADAGADAGPPVVTPTAKLDYLNNVIFRPDTWCRPTDAPGTCTYDPAALAITSVFVSTRTGEIRDGDVEVNAKYFVWADVDIDMTPGRQDLQNALTHEFGHLVGLDHTCFFAQPGLARPFDNNNQPIPDCDNADDTVRATTMFASAIPGDTQKRTLAPDDQQAVCDIYPASHDPMTCAPGQTDPGGCSCAAAGAPLSALASLALLVVAILATRARRRRG
jgi:MYXO-CTERM domain-containing protein